MKDILIFIQIALSILLTISILLQTRGSGLSSSFGGGGEFYQSRRGFENVLLKITVFLAVLFLATSIANVLIK